MSTNNRQAEDSNLSADLITTIGHILAISYPLLALSTGTRATVRLFIRDGIDLLPPLMSAAAALLYLIATVGFVHRRRWSWWLSLVSLGVETTLTLVVGAMSYLSPDVIGNTVWRHFGEDYGYFPLFQPLLGLVWLLWPATRSEYGFSLVTPNKTSPHEG